MRVALDAIPLAAAKTGIGHYTDSLAEWLARIHNDHQYELISPFDFQFDACGRHGHAPKPENLVKKHIPVRSIFRKWWLIGLPAFLRISPLDVFHGTNYCVPVFAPCPTVVTIHDMSLLAHSATHENENVVRGRRRLPIMARRAKKIIAPSEWTKREIISYLGTRPEKIRVIYEGAREKMMPLPESECRAALERLGIRKPYLLYVGTIEPRKNLLTLLRAYESLLRETDTQPQLVMCGGRGWLDDEIFRAVDELKLSDRVIFTGYVDDTDLPALYSSAEIFLYPSLYEGFGLPPLEAMACGAPVITSNSSSLPEVVGDAGLMHEPSDHRALTGAMARLLLEPTAREHHIRAGLDRSKRFSWERAARETQAVYDEVYTQWKARG